MSFKTITAADLFSTSTKQRCTEARQHFVELGRVEEHDRVRRHPDTCQSKVFSLAEADAQWETRHNPRSLLGDMGMCIYSLGDPMDTKKVFLTDDSNFGWEVLKECGWMAMSYRHRGTSHNDFESWRAHLDHFYGKGVVVIESQEELVRHLNGELEAAAV